MDEIQKDELAKLAKKIYRKVKPAVKEVQKKLTPYAPKAFGEKRTYSQDWPVYEMACSQEKLMFYRILKASVDYLNLVYTYKGNGRPSAFYDDLVYSQSSLFLAWRIL